MPMPKPVRRVVAAMVNSLLFVGFVVGGILLYGQHVDSRIFIAVVAFAAIVGGFGMSLLASWAYTDVFDEVDPIDPAASR